MFRQSGMRCVMDWGERCLPYARLALLLAIAHFVISILCLVAWRDHLVQYEHPRTELGVMLAPLTVNAPLAGVTQLPPRLSELLCLMARQSMCFGLLGALFLHRAIIGPWRRNRTGTVLHTILVIATFAAFLVAFQVITAVGLFPRSVGRTLSLNSMNLPTREAKVSWLRKFMLPPGKILATEYTIAHYVGGIAPSGWNYHIAVKVPPGEVDRWLNLQHYGAFTRCEPDSASVDDGEILPQGMDWAHTTTPEYYREDGGSRAIVYRHEGIILLHLVR